eukprot:CAMPEP_0197034028 /NCGR_PEP_ID=MMETSP1384-20130603/12254_1 /TAXON_ID=29189 /ORGANISM="Ammonia sp." /LENGTH=346 /DNA_ID=CAMNT_0042463901 /DNA_START=72 /DNA_END=1109 /DNA_ORIENTATION=+
MKKGKNRNNSSFKIVSARINRFSKPMHPIRAIPMVDFFITGIIHICLIQLCLFLVILHQLTLLLLIFNLELLLLAAIQTSNAIKPFMFPNLRAIAPLRRIKQQYLITQQIMQLRGNPLFIAQRLQIRSKPHLAFVLVSISQQFAVIKAFESLLKLGEFRHLLLAEQIRLLSVQQQPQNEQSNGPDISGRRVHVSRRVVRVRPQLRRRPADAAKILTVDAFVIGAAFMEHVAKVDEEPLVLVLHDVGRLDVAVNVADLVQLPQFVQYLRHNPLAVRFMEGSVRTLTTHVLRQTLRQQLHHQHDGVVEVEQVVIRHEFERSDDQKLADHLVLRLVFVHFANHVTVAKS